MQIKRLPRNPIIVPNMDDRMGSNINGPSLIRVPDWVDNPLGKYYLYFAHHQGNYIRLAYADQLEGPWIIHRRGVLDLSDSFFDDHVASPDVHVLDDSHEIRMYYHGAYAEQYEPQFTRVATSTDGLTFTALPEELGFSYWRVFRWNGYWYTLEMPGVFRRSIDGLIDWQQRPTLFTEDMRHAAVLCEAEQLTVFYSNAFDCPEHILVARLDLGPDWNQWQPSRPQSLLKPEYDWEGALCPVEASERGAIHRPVHQLRDPCVFRDEGKTYLLYAVAGEYGIAIAELLR